MASSLAFHPSGKTIALACLDSRIRLCDVTGKEAKSPKLLPGHQKGVRSVAYSPDGATLASGGEDQTVRLWDATLETPKEKAVLAGHSSTVTALCFRSQQRHPGIGKRGRSDPPVDVARTG